jgi:hypothetical protein
VTAERLRSVLGITNVQYVARKHSLAVGDSALAIVTARTETAKAETFSKGGVQAAIHWIGIRKGRGWEACTAGPRDPWRHSITRMH